MAAFLKSLCMASIAAISVADQFRNEGDLSPPIEGAASTYDATYAEPNELGHESLDYAPSSESYAPQNLLGIAPEYLQQQLLQHPLGYAVNPSVINGHLVNANAHSLPVVNPYWSPLSSLVPHPVAVPVPRPYPVHVEVEKPVPYPVIKWKEVIVERKVPYPVEKLVPYEVEKPYPVPVEKKVFVPVETHVPVPITVLKTVHHGKPFWHKW